MPVWTNADWKDIVDRINELATDPDSGCDSILPLPEVQPNHIWTVQDIEDARNKLIEICSENEFSAELKLWKQDIIDELEAAIAEGWCDCCEEEDRGEADGYVGASTQTAFGGFLVFFVNRTPTATVTCDWAGWARQQVVEPFEEEIPLAVGDPLILESGGPAWVGREFSRWQVFIEPVGGALTAPAVEGPVIDGFIFIGDEAAQAAGLAYETALNEERAAIVSQAQAQADLNNATTPEEIADAQEALDEANEALEEKTTAREEAESNLEATPESKHTPWIQSVDEDLDLIIITSGGEDAFEQTFDTPGAEPGDFEVPNTFLIDLPDGPYMISVPTITEFPATVVEMTLRLLCE